MQDDLWERLSESISPSRLESILNLVDDYTLFSYYMDQEVVINEVILSPLRDPTQDQPDTLPSFVIYEGRNGELRYYDYGKGCKGGNIFDFVGELYGLTSLRDVITKIRQDFELGLITDATEFKVTKRKFLPPGEWKKKFVVPIKDVIPYKEFTQEALNFWQQYHITPEILAEYNVKQVSSIITEATTFAVRNLAFSYRIGLKHKIYQPYEKELKFRNNYPSNYVEGYYQLMKRIQQGCKQPFLFITKSTKDVMVLRRLGQDAVAPKAENIVIPDFIQKKLQEEYTNIVTLFDDDKAGQRGAAKYPYPRIWVPKTETVKDISDYIKLYGPEATKKLLFNLLTNGSKN